MCGLPGERGGLPRATVQWPDARPNGACLLNWLGMDAWARGRGNTPRGAEVRGMSREGGVRARRSTPFCSSLCYSA